MVTDNTIIAGAGPAGLTAVHLLVRDGEQPLLPEQRDRVSAAGAALGLFYGGVVGPHLALRGLFYGLLLGFIIGYIGSWLYNLICRLRR